MANKTSPLTNTEVKHAKGKVKEYNLADGEGLFLRIKPSGSKYWIFNYSRPITKKRANLSFGTYPEISLADARTKPINARALVAKGIDPKNHKIDEIRQQKEILSNTLINVAKNWFEVKKLQSVMITP